MAPFGCHNRREGLHATIEELEHIDREIEDAERRALHNLAKHLRDAVLDLPLESKPGVCFREQATRFDLWAGGCDPGGWGSFR